ncbi:MAG: RagB/SusD family nutrient uptake outer membrane protein [Bacteroidaceae bacterium]|nr:RagB/SusD family nutrient uptake outer membrane protein [Bacteroidaceae bacterium]
MKKLFIYGAMALSVVLSSCSDSFLEVEPTTQDLESTYYTTVDELESALVAAYDPLQWADYAWGQYNGFNFLSDAMSDDVRVGGGSVSDDKVLQMLRFFKATGEYTPSDFWVVMYSGINRSNIAINKTEVFDGTITDTERSTIVSEGKTLRAFYYFWLWKLWGNVPYYSENPTSEFIVPQMDADSVYSHIIADLDDVINADILPMKESSDRYGHVTQAMAMMLKTDAVLYQNDESRYAECLSNMKTIISSREYALVDSFADLWESDNEWNTETIFDINYFSVNGVRSWDNALGCGGTVYPKLIGINGLNDPSGTYESGWGFEPVEKGIYDLYDDADQRKDAGILNMNKYIVETGATYTPRYDDTGGYFLRKYLPRVGGNTGCVGSSDMNFDNNLRMYRYAQTLLYAAELTLRTGGSVSDAQGYFDQVRNRAYNGSAPVKTVSLDNILLENRLEFVGEGHRYFDLVRTGNAVSVLGSRGYTEDKKYLPIPQSEIDKAEGTLTQNAY